MYTDWQYYNSVWVPCGQKIQSNYLISHPTINERSPSRLSASVITLLGQDCGTDPQDNGARSNIKVDLMRLLHGSFVPTVSLITDIL